MVCVLGQFHGRLGSLVYFSLLLLCASTRQVQVFGGGITSAREMFLISRVSISVRIAHEMCAPVGILFTLCIR